MPVKIVGSKSQTICELDGNRTWSLPQLKAAIAEKSQVPAQEQSLWYGGDPLGLQGLGVVSNRKYLSVTMRRWSQEAETVVKEKTREAVQKLLDSQDIDPLASNSLGQTLIFYAVQNVKHGKEIVSLLATRYSVKLDLNDVHGQSAVYYLAKTGNVDCLQLFVEQNVDLNQPDKKGQTPIFFAASQGVPEMITALFEAGADVQHRDARGSKPVRWAKDVANFQALVVCWLRVDDSMLVWNKLSSNTFEGRDVDLIVRSPERTSGPIQYSGDVYAVCLANLADARELATLEDEFIKDHREMLHDTLDDSDPRARSKVCETVGLKPNPKDRLSIIQQITAARLDVKWTLKIMRVHGFGSKHLKDGMKVEVAGYCYCYLKEPSDTSPPGAPGTFTVSHLKVGAHHQRRGCATLLLAGAILRMERLISQRKVTNYLPFISISMIEENLSAQNLYKKLGWQATPGISASDSEVKWIRMKLRPFPQQDVVQKMLKNVRGDPGIAPEVAVKLVVPSPKVKAKGKAKARGR